MLFSQATGRSRADGEEPQAAPVQPGAGGMRQNGVCRHPGRAETDETASGAALNWSFPAAKPPDGAKGGRAY